MKLELANGGRVQCEVIDEGAAAQRRPYVMLVVCAPGGTAQAVPLDEGNAEALEHALIAARLQAQTRAAGR